MRGSPFRSLAPARVLAAVWIFAPLPVQAVTPDVFYELQTVAHSGQSGLTLVASPTVNDWGSVAFLGQDPSGQALWIGDGDSAPRNISPGFASATRVYSSSLQLNNAERLVAKDRVSGSPPTHIIRRWNTLLTDAPETVAIGGIPTKICDGGSRAGQVCLQSIPDCPIFVLDVLVGYAACTTAAGSSDFAFVLNPTMNNNDEVAFTAPVPDTFETLLVTPAGPGTFNTVQLAGHSIAAFPAIADSGDVVVRRADPGDDTAYRIDVFDYEMATAQPIAGAGNGFTAVGARPGISDSGAVVAFTGDRGDGFGVFFATDEDGVYVLHSEPIAGEPGHVRPELGTDGGTYRGLPGPDAPIYFEAVDADSHVSVAHVEVGRPGLLDDAFVFAFVAKPNKAAPASYFVPGRRFSDQLGLWTVQVDVREDPDSVTGYSYEIGLPVPVVQVGDSIAGLPGAVTGIGVGDSLALIADRVQLPIEPDLDEEARNSLQRGSYRAAFVVGDAAGNSAVVKATRENSCDAASRRSDNWNGVALPRLPQGYPGPWALDMLDSQPQALSPQKTLAWKGCVVTTMAAQLSLAAAEVGSDGEWSTVGQLNDFLARKDARIPESEALKAFELGGNLRREHAVTLFSRYVLANSFKLSWENCREWSLHCTSGSDQANAFVYGALCGSDRAPVASRVTLKPAKPYGHDVLITSVANSRYFIADPAGVVSDPARRPRGVTMDDYGLFRAVGYVHDTGFSVQAARAPEDVGYLRFSIDAVGLPLVTDGVNRRTGFLSVDGDPLEEIPDAYAAVEGNQSPEDESEADPPTYVVVVGHPDGAQMRAQVLGVEDGPFSLSISSVEPDGTNGTLIATLSGYAVTGKASTYDVNPAAGSVTLLSLPVPSVLGQLQPDAEDTLATAGLSLGSVAIVADAAAAGTVVGQDPNAGAVVSPETAVDLVVSGGPEATTTTIPVSTTLPDTTTTTVGETTTTTIQAHHGCSKPVTEGTDPAASDCLYILRAAIGAVTCVPECICDTIGGDGITAADALLCLRKAVGQDVFPACPC